MGDEDNAKPVNVDPRWCVAQSTLGTDELTPDSIQEALRMYLQPIKNDDPKLDFYTIYKRETTEYDTEYMQKYNEDLNTTLIFVGSVFRLSAYNVDHILRLVCSPRSALPSLSMSNRSSSQIPANGQKPTSALFSSASTEPLFPTKTLSLPQRGIVPPRRSSRPQTSCMRVYLCPSWPRSSQCWASRG
jgi:hypothetical protein